MKKRQTATAIIAGIMLITAAASPAAAAVEAPGPVGYAASTTSGLLDTVFDFLTGFFSTGDTGIQTEANDTDRSAGTDRQPPPSTPDRPGIAQAAAPDVWLQQVRGRGLQPRVSDTAGDRVTATLSTGSGASATFRNVSVDWNRTPAVTHRRDAHGMDDFVWVDDNGFNASGTFDARITLPGIYETVQACGGERTDPNCRSIQRFSPGTSRPYYRVVNGRTVVYLDHFSGAGGSNTNKKWFNASGRHSWTVPTGIEEVRITVWGAKGGDGDDFEGEDAGVGRPGGKAMARFAVSPGDTLYMCVGGKGTHPDVGAVAGGGVCGGGDGFSPSDSTTDPASGGGGGLTNVSLNSKSRAGTLLVAGGGGGGGSVSGADAHNATAGGAGGPNIGKRGQHANLSNADAGGGKGGTQSTGGSGGSGGGAGSDGATGQGGAGGSDSGGAGAEAAAGGGGGGWYGGGGGGATASSGGTTNAVGAGGGGGSNYINTTEPFFVSFSTNESGVLSGNNGNGTVLIEYNAPPVIESPVTFNGTDYQNLQQQTDFLRSDTLTIRANITDDSFSSLSNINITLRNASGMNVVSNASMTNISALSGGGTFEYNRSLTGAEVGTWTFTIWANDTNNALDTTTGTFDVYIPATLDISFFNTTFLRLDHHDTFNVTANVTCKGQGTDAPDAECGQVSGKLHSADFDLEPENVVPTANGTPFYVERQRDEAAGEPQVIGSGLGSYDRDFGRQVVRTSDGTLYVTVFNGSHMTVWKSRDGFEWTKQNPDNSFSGDENNYDNIDAVLDGGGKLHFVYGNFNAVWGHEVEYGNYSTGSDAFGTTETIAILSNPGAIDVDGKGVPHAMTYFSDNSVTNYHNRSGWTWNTTAAGPKGSLTQDLVVNHSRIPIMTWINDSEATLEVAKADSTGASSFSRHEVDLAVNDSQGTASTSLVVNDSGHIWIGYVDGNDEITLVEHRPGDPWSTWQSPVRNGELGREPSVAINGSEVFVFYENMTDDIVYDKYNGTHWAGETGLAIGKYRDVTAKWSLRNDYFSDSYIDYLYSDGTDLYWNNLSLKPDANPATCTPDPLTDGDECSLTWTVNATQRGKFNIDANFSSTASWITENDSDNRKVNVDAGNLSIDFFNTSFLELDRFDEFNVTFNVSCTGYEADDQCGTVDGEVHYDDYDVEPENVVPTERGTPFFIDPVGQEQTYVTAQDWWTAGNQPDIHVTSINSTLTAEGQSTTHVTVNASNFGFGTWQVAVDLWNQSAGTLDWQSTSMGTEKTGVNTIASGDVDGDGDLDAVLGTVQETFGPHANISFWENTGGDGSTWSKTEVGGPQTFYSVALGDVDRDGDLDVVSGDFSDDVEFWENTAGDGSSWASSFLIGDLTDPVSAVALGDVDGDGDLDVISGDDDINTGAGNVTFWENTAGDGSSWGSGVELGQTSNGVNSLSLGDVDGDGDLDVISAAETASASDAALVFWENTAGDGATWSKTVVSEGEDLLSVSIGDVDDDSDLDLVSGDRAGNVTFWENTAGDGSSWGSGVELGTINGDVRSISLADVDSDGDLDAVSGTFGGQGIFWENTAGDGSNWSDTQIGSTISATTTGDVDGDGDVDLLAGADNGFDSSTVDFWENTGVSSVLIGSTSLSFDDVNGSAKTAEFTWTPAARQYTLVAVADPFKNFTSVFRTQDQSGSMGNRLVQSADLRENPKTCTPNPLTDGDTCSVTWTVNATEKGAFNLDANHSTTMPGLFRNDSENRQVNVDMGFLDVSLVSGSPIGLDQYDTFWLNASLTCQGEADDICGSVDGESHYDSSGEPETVVSTTEGDTPFFVAGGTATTQAFFNASSDWWTAGNAPDIHVESINSTLTPGEPSWSNVTVNASNFGQGNWSVNVSLWKAGTGPFNTSPVANISDSKIDTAIGDVNGDGRMDIVAPNSTDTAKVWLQQDDGGFTQQVNLTHPNLPRDVSLGDVDGDGRTDVVTATAGGQAVVWRQQSGTTFTPWANLTDQESLPAASVGDITGDGMVDVVTASNNNVADGDLDTDDGTGQAVVWEQTETGFTPIANLTHASDIFWLALGDVDDDGRMDVVADESGNNQAVVWRQQSGTTFTPWANLTHAGAVEPASLGDVDSDGRMDIVTASGSEAVVWRQQSGATFTPWKNVTDSNDIRSVLLGDLNADGRMDVVTAGLSQQAVVWGQADGGFTPIGNLTESDSIDALALGDVNTDGALDVVTTRNNGGTVVWAQQDGSSFLASTMVAFDDVNGSAKTAKISWTPDAGSYNLEAVADPFRNYTSIFETQDGGGAVNNRIVQSVDLSGGTSNPAMCASSLAKGQSCFTNFSINATASSGTYNLDVNFTSEFSPGIVENDTVNLGTCIGGAGSDPSALACLPPSRGDWPIGCSCTIDETVSAPENVSVENGATVNVTGSGTLDLDMATDHLSVGPLSNILIQPPGAIS